MNRWSAAGNAMKEVDMSDALQSMLSAKQTTSTLNPNSKNLTEAEKME